VVRACQSAAKKEAVIFILQIDPVLEYAMVMTEMQAAGRTHAGQNTLLGSDKTQRELLVRTGSKQAREYTGKTTKNHGKSPIQECPSLLPDKKKADHRPAMLQQSRRESKAHGKYMRNGHVCHDDPSSSE
jgi:hypothetical protein